MEFLSPDIDKWKPSKAVNKNPTGTDEVCGLQLPKLRAGSQSACAMATNPWAKEHGKTANNLC